MVIIVPSVPVVQTFSLKFQFILVKHLATQSLVVVGGDFGTTTGTVYAGFMPSNWPHSPSLKPEYR